MNHLEKDIIIDVFLGHLRIRIMQCWYRTVTSSETEAYYLIPTFHRLLRKSGMKAFAEQYLQRIPNAHNTETHSYPLYC